MSSQTNPNPATLSLPWPTLTTGGTTVGGDLQLTNNGSVVFVNGIEQITQRIIRRYFTGPAQLQADGTYVPADYIFDPNYGIGACRLVGSSIDSALASALTQKIKAAVLIDEGVDTTQDPEITLYAAQNGSVWASVTIYLLNTTPTELNFLALGNNSQ